MDRNAGPDALAVDSAPFSSAIRARRGYWAFTNTVTDKGLPSIRTGIGFGRLDNVAYITAVSSASGPPFNGAVFEFTRKRTRQSAP